MSETSETYSNLPEQPTAGAAEPAPRPPSRQTLVKPVRSATAGPSAAVLTLGSAACAVAGFGAVWWLGVGRRAPSVDPVAPAVAIASAEEDGSTDRPSPPRFFVPAGADEGSEPKPAVTEQAETTSRFAAQPASLEDEPEDETQRQADLQPGDPKPSSPSSGPPS